MNDVQVTVNRQPIVAKVDGNGIAVSVPPPEPVAAQVQSGIGPQGPSGITTLAGAADVAIDNTADGDVLRYSSGRWRNYPQLDLVDGGNW